MTSLTFATRLASGVALAGATGLLIAGCGIAGPAPSTTTTVTQTIPAAGGSATPAASGGATSAPSPEAASGCLASGLQGQLGASQGTAGTIYQVVQLTNISSATCTLYGYAGASFVTGVGGSQVGRAAARNPAIAPALVTLAPGGQANFLLAIHDAGAFPNCQLTDVDWLRIYPPGDYGDVYVQYDAQGCQNSSDSILSVTAVRSGAGSASY
jgi:Protein of unknown function (DUF4232)